MLNRIHKLSPLLINQIAAGEVVTRPASVVKELVENAIDAGATHIDIRIEQGGLGLIEVCDDGRGIHPDDLQLAVTRHATSKLADVGELTGIDSLGFRGEALASIAAVAHLTLTSSHDTSGIGQRLVLDGSEASQARITPIVKTQGTTVTVRDLYFNVPARRSHLKSLTTEFAHIEQVVQRLAIGFADIDFTLYHQGKPRLRLAKADSQQSTPMLPLLRLEQALGLPLAPVAHEFGLSLANLTHFHADNAQVSGWLFVAPDSGSALPRLLYINQRLVSDVAISQTLQKAARQADLPSLGYALNFNLPADWINVNIHPSKQQVKIQPLTNILARLQHAVLGQLKALSERLTFSPAQPIAAEHTPASPTASIQPYPAARMTLATKQVNAPQTAYQTSATLADADSVTNFATTSAKAIAKATATEQAAVVTGQQSPAMIFLHEIDHPKHGNVVLVLCQQRLYALPSEVWQGFTQPTLADLNTHALSARSLETLTDWLLMTTTPTFCEHTPCSPSSV